MKNIFKVIFADFHIKVLALIAAAGVWVYAVNAGKQINTLEASVPAQVFNLRNDLAISSEIPSVKLQVRADTNIFKTLSAKDFSAFIDLNGFSEGTYTVGLKVVSDNANVQVLGKTPETAVVTLERRINKKFDVKVETKGSLAEGFGAGTPALNPASITIGGAQSTLERIAKVVAPVTFQGEESDVTQTTNIVAFDSANKKIENLSITPTTVQVTVPVERQKDTKTVGIEPRIIGTPGSGFAVDSVTLDRSTVTVIGKSSTLAPITSLQTATVNIAGITRDTTKTVSLVLPEGITAKDGNDVKVTVKLVSTLRQQTVNAQILFVGTPSNLKLTNHTPTTIAVTVSGSQGVIASIGTGDITIQVDLSQATEGTQEISITNGNIHIPAGASLVSFTPQKVSVTLQAQ